MIKEVHLPVKCKVAIHHNGGDLSSHIFLKSEKMHTK